MDFISDPVELTCSLAKLLHAFLADHIKYDFWSQVTGHMNITTETGDNISIAVNETIIKISTEETAVQSNSYPIPNFQDSRLQRNSTHSLNHNKNSTNINHTLNIVPWEVPESKPLFLNSDIAIASFNSSHDQTTNENSVEDRPICQIADVCGSSTDGNSLFLTKKEACSDEDEANVVSDSNKEQELSVLTKKGKKFC